MLSLKESGTKFTQMELLDGNVGLACLSQLIHWDQNEIILLFGFDFGVSSGCAHGSFLALLLGVGNCTWLSPVQCKHLIHCTVWFLDYLQKVKS